MDEERDVVVFEDEDGNELELDVIDYFNYNGQEYAILMDFSDLDECGCDACGHDHDEECGCDHVEKDVFVMKVVVDGDMEEFIPVEDETMNELEEIVQQRLDSWVEEEDEYDDE